MTFLNLSQILQRNECDQGILFDKKKDSERKNRKSERSMRNNKNDPNLDKIKEIYNNL